jgi:hypothetical protein
MSTISIESFSESVNDKIIRGLLVASQPVIEVWFPYSIETVKLLRVGLNIAVRNTASVHLNDVSGLTEDQHFTLLRIDSVTTRHFHVDRIRQDRSDVPISIESLLDEKQKEWRRTLVDPEENNLRIVIEASETGQELFLPMSASEVRGFAQKIQPQAGAIMLGEIAYLMTQPIVERMVNRGMKTPAEDNSVIVAGAHTLYRNPPLDVYVDTDALFRRHFGIFGFTGAGKSNLLSTFVSNSMGAGKDIHAEGEPNILLFDVNNEYFGLLIDVMCRRDSYVVYLDQEIGQAMSEFLSGNMEAVDEAVHELLSTTTFSGAVNSFRRSGEGAAMLASITRYLLLAGRFRVFIPDHEILSTAAAMGAIIKIAEGIKLPAGTGRDKKKAAFAAIMEALMESIFDPSRDLSSSDFAAWLTIVQGAITYCSSDDDADDDKNEVAPLLTPHIPKGGKDKHYSELLKPFEKLASEIDRMRKVFESPVIRKGFAVGVSDLMQSLHDNRRSLVVFLGTENTLRMFANLFGTAMYEIRKKNGIVDPATVFIFDEADIFIPGNSAPTADEDKEAIKASRQVATTLSRRGRKYGLGLGIATQRITYLDTSILGQLNSYFVGKLPRLSDRTRIAEGFGIEANSLRNGISNVGDWVILSHIAVGDRGNALPVHFDNADERIIDFIKEFSIEEYPELKKNVEMFDYRQSLANVFSDLVKDVTNTDFLP